jgi:LCP family protein required for cell wall assembly
MAFSYNKTKDLDIAAKALSSKLTEMTSIETPYYALVDFNGFSELINKVDGIDVYIPKKVYDSTYPGPNYSYTTFSINSGQQHLDGVTALKYARSRHSSSDFSRSQRQQLILKGLLTKLTQKGISIDTIKELY